MYVLSDTLRRRNNNFDLLRLMASLAVMLGHSYGIQPGGMESMLALTHRESFGSLAVYAFFLISGMLVSASFAARPQLLPFIVARATRIWPGVIVCSAFIAFVVGPIFSSLPAIGFLSTPDVFRWLARNASLMGQVGGPLPGLFNDNHLPSLVNATAWTLPVELQCYVLVLVAGVTGLIRSRWGLTAFGVVAAVAFAYFVVHPLNSEFLKNFFILALAYSFYPVPFFILGMVLYGLREKVVVSGKLALVLLTGAVVLRYTPPGTVFLYLCFTYGLLWFSSARAFFPLRPRHDYSYGIYLYGFVVQQVFASFHPTMNNYLSLLVTMPITVALAALSWHLIEQPALQWSGRRRARDKIQTSTALVSLESSSGTVN